MLHHKDTIKDVNLNIFNREAELTKPLIRLFQNSPNVLKELLLALSKCLDAKRKIKSTSLEAVLYTAINNLIPNGETIDNTSTITNESIQEEVKRITDGADIPGKQAFYSRDLGVEVSYAKITKTLVDKFKAEKTLIGTGNQRKRGVRFTKDDLDRKSIDYDVPDKIEILPYNKNALSGPDSFDSVLLEDGYGTDAGDKSGSLGSLGTLSEGKDGDINEGAHAQTSEEIDRVIKPENTPAYPEKVSKVFQASQNQNIEDAMAQPHEEPIFRDLPEMPEEPEDDLDIVSEKELESLQEPSKESFNPIVSIEDFFSNDIPLENHSIAESPCFPILNTKPGEIPTQTVYYCELHPDLGSTFLSQIELHCRQKEPEHHKAAILAKRGESA
jgi:hypothetical protein